MNKEKKIASVQKGWFGKNPSDLQIGVHIRYTFGSNQFGKPHFADEEEIILCSNEAEQEQVYNFWKYKYRKNIFPRNLQI